MSINTVQEQNERERFPLLSDTNINTILLNGAHTSLSCLKRAQSYDERLFFYAEIGVFLEVSLSRGAGITDETRDRLESMHRKATYVLMEANKAARVSA